MHRREGDEATRDGAADPLGRAREVVRRMVQPGGCAWHGAQTHESLTRFLVEETAEFIDAVERRLPAEATAGELGDVLYQVLFHAAIAERDGEGYDLDVVADALADKLIARHPHVFGDRGYMSVEQLHDEWERLKEDAEGVERGSRGVLEGIPAGMPSLARAAKVIDRLARAGVDPEIPSRGGAQSDETRIGDALLGIVAEANALGVDPDKALRKAVDRLSR